MKTAALVIIGHHLNHLLIQCIFLNIGTISLVVSFLSAPSNRHLFFIRSTPLLLAFSSVYSCAGVMFIQTVIFLHPHGTSLTQLPYDIVAFAVYALGYLPGLGRLSNRFERNRALNDRDARFNDASTIATLCRIPTLLLLLLALLIIALNDQAKFTAFVVMLALVLYSRMLGAAK